jgi:flagellar hook protein FlgE
MLEVVGHNLANVNTTGFKSGRILFADLVYETLRSGTSGEVGTLGSVNPIQIGSGVRVSQVSRNLSQGNLGQTGSQLDVALEGDGFFSLSNGTDLLYTRAGAFAIDETGFLIDPATGYKVQRFGTVGESSGTGLAFQTPGDNSIAVPLGASIPGMQTSEVQIAGNLSSLSSGITAEVLSSAVPWTSTGTAATAATLLNDLDGNVAPYVAGDALMILGTDADGSTVNVSLSVTPATTLGDLVVAIDTAFAGATASLDASGRINLTADQAGPALLSLSLTDAPANTGSTPFAEHGFLVSVDGQDADTVRGGIEVFDARGAAHTLGVLLTKQTDGTWNLEVSLDPGEGTLLDAQVDGIQFNTNGSFAQVLGTGAGDARIEIQFAGDPVTQSVNVSFGTPGQFDGLTAVGAPSSLSVDSNGYLPGALTSVQIDSDGTIYGLSSNGLQIALAQLAVATFENQAGLHSDGNNYLTASLSSGPPELGTALSGSRGAIRANHLEESNVDLALEFTRLIIAQRGFSANARTINVTDEILEELTNLVR